MSEPSASTLQSIASASPRVPSDGLARTPEDAPARITTDAPTRTPADALAHTAADALTHTAADALVGTVGDDRVSALAVHEPSNDGTTAAHSVRGRDRLESPRESEPVQRQEGGPPHGARGRMLDSAPVGEHRRTPWKTWQRVTAGVGAFGILAAFVVAQPVAGAAAGVASGENPSARTAVTELTGPHPANVALPADFPADRGYRPVKFGELLVDPNGECSSPVRLPEEFRTACQAHDLGYDVLRYADDHGQPLGSWARQAIDAVLDQRMWTACEHRHGLSRSRCHTMAVVAGTAVDLNSRRQNYATPRPEYLFGIRLSGKHLGHQFLIIAAPAALVLSALALLLTEFARGRRRRNSNPAHNTAQ